MSGPAENAGDKLHGEDITKEENPGAEVWVSSSFNVFLRCLK